MITFGVKNQVIKKSVLVSRLANYNLPPFVLEMVASKCGSELARKGKITTILDSMNESALTLLHKIFVECEDDEEGEFSDYRFGVFVSSKVHSKIMFDQSVRGKSGTVYNVKVAVFGGKGLVAVGENKSTGRKVSLDELERFNNMVKDVSRSEDGLNMLYAFYGSAVGYEEGAFRAFLDTVKQSNPANKREKSAPATTMVLLEFKQRNMNQVLSTELR
ncbi:MAG: hypothetical protein ACE5J2_03370 [Nitrososphaerales archaeon]